MKLSQRILTLGAASVIGLGVLAPMASADRKTDVTIGLGAASIALLATHHYAAGALGVGLTVLSAESRPCQPVYVASVDRYRSDDRRDNRRDDKRGDRRDNSRDRRW